MRIEKIDGGEKAKSDSLSRGELLGVYKSEYKSADRIKRRRTSKATNFPLPTVQPIGERVAGRVAVSSTFQHSPLTIISLQTFRHSFSSRDCCWRDFLAKDDPAPLSTLPYCYQCHQTRHIFDFHLHLSMDDTSSTAPNNGQVPQDMETGRSEQGPT